MADDDVLDNGPDDDDDDVGIDLDKPANTRKTTSRDDSDEDDDEDDDGDKGDDRKPADKKPAGKTYTQEDVDKLKTSLTAARAEARDKIRDLNKKVSDLRKAQKPPADGEDEVAKAREEAAAEVERRLKPVAVRAAAKAAFLAAHLQNATEARVGRLVRQLDMDAIEIDPDDGSITGLDEQVDALVEEYPELFTAAKGDDEEDEKPKPKRVPRGDAADRRPAKRDERKLTTGEKHAMRLQGANR